MVVNPEIRAAEIIAAIRTEYRTGGWFEMITEHEQIGWDLFEDEWWTGKVASKAPRTNRHWAGWLVAQWWW